MKSLLRYLILFLVLICLLRGKVRATTYDWIGNASSGSKTDWNNPKNWQNPALLFPITPTVPPGPGDDVHIGLLSFTNPPTVTSTNVTAVCASITIGSLLPSLSPNALPLTIDGNLQVFGPIIMTPSVVISYTTLIQGAGVLSCTSVQVGTTALLVSLLNFSTTLTLKSTIAQFNISGGVIVTTASLLIGKVDGLFTLQDGVTTIKGKILTQGVGLLALSAVNPRFSIDMPAGTTASATLQLTNADPIDPASLTGSIDFFNNTGGTGVSTVNYSGLNDQVIHTNTTPSLDAGPSTYQNLIISGTGTKTINGGNLTIGTDFTTLTATPGTTSTTVSFNLNNPITTIGGKWTNNASTTITGGTGNTTLAGKLSNAGAINMASGNLTIGGNYDNSGAFVQAAVKSDPTSGTPTNTTFFTTPSAALTGNTGNSTAFNNLVFTGGSGATPSITGIGSFSVSSVGILQIKTAGTTLTSTNGVLTLKSDANGSASVAPLPSSTTTITGNINVQRYAVGGAGRRNYRLLSSPVNQSTINGLPAYGFIDLQATTMISGYGAVGAYNGSLTPPSNAFDLTPLGNPSVFFYYEPDADPINQMISKSDYKGINSINERFPIGNGFLFFFRGDRTINGLNGIAKTSTASTPQNTTMNFLGNLNQGPINVNIPTNPTATVNGNIVYITPTTAVSPTFSYTVHTPANDGLHLIGNPYACAIDLEGITLTNSSNNIYMLNNSGTFGVYQKGTPTGSLNNGVGRFVLSGQGFFIQGNSSAASVSFSETCKATTFSSSLVPTTFAVAKPTIFAVSKMQTNNVQQSEDAVPTSTPHIMSISLTLDSVNNNETTIQFGEKTAKNSFDRQEDAYYMSGPAQTTFLASYTKDNQPCLINHMGSLDSIKTIPLYAEGQKDGLYTFKFTGASAIDQRYKFYLVDNFKKDSLDLSANDVYNFNIQRSNTQTFGATRFILVRHDSGLHYNLLTFNGTKQNNAVALSWKTEYEGDYTNFLLQRSTDEGKSYTIIDSVKANGSGTYAFIDNKANDGTNQYRLVQNVGADASRFSNIVIADFLGLSKFKVYPNPAIDIIKVDFDAPADVTFLTVKIYNINGRVVGNIKTTTSKTSSQDVSQLPRGTYIIKVSGDNNKLYGTKKFIKL